MASILRGQIGSWDHHLVITLQGAALEWLDSLKCDRRLLTQVDPIARQIRLTADPEGHHIGFRGSRNAVLHGFRIDWRLVDCSPLPRFELMPVDLKADGFSSLIAHIPPDHQLPWPRLRDCESYAAVDVACAELERRMTSAALAYGAGIMPKHWKWVPPTDEVRDLLPPGFWAEALARAVSAAFVGRRQEAQGSASMPQV